MTLRQRARILIESAHFHKTQSALHRRRAKSCMEQLAHLKEKYGIQLIREERNFHGEPPAGTQDRDPA